MPESITSNDQLRVRGVCRDTDDRDLRVFFNRRVTDNEMRLIHEHLKTITGQVSPDETTPVTPREPGWKCTVCGRDNSPSDTHCPQCEYSRMHTIAGVKHERRCGGYPCVCGAVPSVKAKAPRCEFVGYGDIQCARQAGHDGPHKEFP